jgi:hypothetical protein
VVTYSSAVGRLCCRAALLSLRLLGSTIQAFYAASVYTAAGSDVLELNQICLAYEGLDSIQRHVRIRQIRQIRSRRRGRWVTHVNLHDRTVLDTSLTATLDHL